MMTKIGEITVGTLLKRVVPSCHPYVKHMGVYEVIKIDKFGAAVMNEERHSWRIDTSLYEIVGHVDDPIIEELNQMLEINLLRNRAVEIISNMTGSPLGFGVLTNEELLDRKL